MAKRPVPPHRNADHQAPLPWAKMLMVVGLFFFTGLMYTVQGLSGYFTGSIVGQPTTLLQGYSCPGSSAAFEVSPVPALFGYEKGNTEYNRKEMLRINKKNHGLTAWYSYDKGFNESAKAQLIDILAYEKNPDQWITRIYNAIKNDGSPHGSADFVTKWLSPDNHHLPTLYPYTSGYVVEAVEGHAGYGNYVSVCTDVVTNSGKTLRVLYNVAHLQNLNVSAGQIISAGTELGKIGSTGNSSTPHAHITIHPDLYWTTSYRTQYDAGYNFYYATSAADTLVKTIDPVAVLLNPALAYSIVENDDRRQALFANPTQYVASLSNSVAYVGDIPTDSGTASIIDVPEQPVFTDFRITTDDSTLKINEKTLVTVEALDQNGALYTGFTESIDVVLSSASASFQNVEQMNAGVARFEVTDSTPGEVVVQVSNQGTITEEKKIVFLDELKYLEVTAPQKTTLGNTVAVALRPVGTRGGVISERVEVVSTVFPAVVNPQTVVLENGRGELPFNADTEGVYELRFTTDNAVQEKIFIAVERPVGVVVEDTGASSEDSSSTDEDTPGEDVSENTEEPDTSDDEAENPTVPEEETDESTFEDDVRVNDQPTGPVLVNADGIVYLEGDDYAIHEVDGMTVMVFSDADVTSDFPVEMRFTVPTGTETVSIFTGLNDRNFPDSGELKLSKYTPGQEFIRYYPKYVPEDTYKKVVAYQADGSVLAERVFTWSPASLHPFIDVVEGSTDAQVYQAVKALKDAGVVNGNPDGTYGVDDAINRASTAAILIRAFYTDVDLTTLKVTSIDFNDVPLDAWYAPAIWFASQEEVNGQQKPVIIKGYQGNANPAGAVQIEEFVTMIFRLLEIETPETEVWYEGAVQEAIDRGLMSSAERSYIGTSLPRGLVARIMVQALQLAEELVEDGDLEADFDDAAIDEELAVLDEAFGIALVEESSVEEVADAIGGPETDTLVVNTDSEGELPPFAAENMAYEFSGSSLSLTWESSFSGSFKVYRETVGGTGEILIGSTGGTGFIDQTAKAGKSYYYRVEFTGQTSRRGELLVEL